MVWSWTFILASSLGPRILVCLLSIGFLGVFLQCFFLEQSLDSVLVSVSSIGVLLSRRSRRGGDIRTFRPGFSSTETEMQMILNDESKHSYQSRALLFGYPTLPSYTNLPGWLQAAGKGWLGIRNKKTLQPYESGKKIYILNILFFSGFKARICCIFQILTYSNRYYFFRFISRWLKTNAYQIWFKFLLPEFEKLGFLFFSWITTTTKIKRNLIFGF